MLPWARFPIVGPRLHVLREEGWGAGPVARGAGCPHLQPAPKVASLLLQTMIQHQALLLCRYANLTNRLYLQGGRASAIAVNVATGRALPEDWTRRESSHVNSSQYRRVARGVSRLYGTMSSDADYASFLERANRDSGCVETNEEPKKRYGTKSVNSEVPKGLEQVEEYYMSDADEPFEPVALRFDGTSVSAGMWR